MPVNKKTLSNIKVSKFRSAYRQIAEQLRAEIGVGHFLPGVMLPTAIQLAETWNVSTFTVHKALTLLVESGQLVRRRGAGTFVAEPNVGLKTVALYYGRNFLALGSATDFYRRLNQCLTQKLTAQKMENRVYIDSRPHGDNLELLEDLKSAVERREVQAVIAPMLTDVDLPLLQKLPIPCVFGSNRKLPNNVFYDFRQFLRVALDRLIEQGCRDIGLISGIQTQDENADHELFMSHFLELAEERNLTLRNEWMRAPEKLILPQDLEGFGRKEFGQMWAQKARPQGLIVYPDAVVRGVAWALAENQVSVPEDLQLVLHRNKGIPLICPFPATWLTTDVEAIAQAMIDQIKRQMNGEPVEMISMPFLVDQEEGH